jgi:hypothetical protein
MKTTTARRIKSLSIFCIAALALLPGLSHAWWNGDWDTRKKLTLNTAQAATKEPLTQVPVLVRLHTGNFDFGNVKDNGGDIRFVAEDDKTQLKYHIEKFDAVNEMALVWVQVPKLTPGKADTIWMYYGNSKATPADDVKATFDANQVAVYHFDETEGLPQDRSGKGNNATQSGAKVGEGSLVGRGATFDGRQHDHRPCLAHAQVSGCAGFHRFGLDQDGRRAKQCSSVPAAGWAKVNQLEYLRWQTRCRLWSDGNAENHGCYAGSVASRGADCRAGSDRVSGREGDRAGAGHACRYARRHYFRQTLYRRDGRTEIVQCGAFGRLDQDRGGKPGGRCTAGGVRSG